jgi:uncharacterized lipoprotein YddW (UPF0748 family)
MDNVATPARGVVSRGLAGIQEGTSVRHRFSSRITIAAVMVVSLVLASVAHTDSDDVPRVAIVFGHHSYMDSPRGEGASAVTYMNTVRQALDAVGVRYAVVNDLTVETGGLGCYDIAIFPYNFVVPEEEEKAIERYVTAGGKIVVFYSISERVAALLGFRVGGRKEGDFYALLLRAERLRGLPEQIVQGSWNIRPIESPAPDAEIIGQWAGAEGKPLDEPGLLISPRGAYLGHVLTEGDSFRKGRMLLAVLGELSPQVWSEAVARALSNAAGAVEGMAGKVMARPTSDSQWRARSTLAEVRAELAQARGLAAQGKAEEAIAAALEARERAALAYIESAPEREHELRGVWVHDGYGVPGWGWERSIRVLHEGGFNAVFANLLWAGVAHYPSDHLPVDERVATQGDQIAECLRWCKEYGVELHVWKVNYNLQNAPPRFVDALRDEDRLQRHADGSEVLWLCPSDPRNFELERGSMLEVVRKYDVAGIHFDYIRYPHGEACYCDGCRERFSRDTGAAPENWPGDVLAGPLLDQYTQWRRDQITRLVRAVAEGARRIRPGIMVSAAVFSWPGAINWVNQDWPHWIDEGLLDFVCPMNYTSDREHLERMVVGEVNIVAGRIPLYIGVGEFIIAETHDLIDQLESARRLGADGFVCFSYEHLGRTEGRLAQLHSSLTATETVPPHPAPRVEFRFGEGAEGRLGPAYPEGASVGLEVVLSSASNYAQQVTAALGAVWLETADGESMRRLGAVRSDKPVAIAATLGVPPGVYRLAVRGTALLSSGEGRDFVIRSRPFEVVPGAMGPSS